MDGQDGQDDAALRLRAAAHARLRSLRAPHCAGSCTRMGVAAMAIPLPRPTCSRTGVSRMPRVIALLRACLMPNEPSHP